MEEKGIVVDRLYKRDAKRLEAIQKQQKLKDEVNAFSEQLDYFCTVFKEKTDKIEMALENTSNLDKSQLVSHFDKIRSDLRELQKYLAASSLFLKDYNIRKSQDIVQDLQTRSSDLESVYFPKKKFGFRNKKPNKKVLNNDEVDNMNTFKDSSNILCDQKRKEKTSWDVVTCGFSNISNQKLCLNSESVYKKDVTLQHLHNCIITLQGCPATLHLDHLTDCVIISGPVNTSVFVDRCVGNKMAIACQQLRCHSSSDCEVYLHVTSKAIIEDCTDIKVAPYNLKYSEVEKDFAMSGLDLNVNNWNNLDDFNWLVSDVASPNWKVLDENLRINLWDTYVNSVKSD